MNMIEICLNPDNETVGEYTDYIVYVRLCTTLFCLQIGKFALSYFVLVRYRRGDIQGNRRGPQQHISS